MEDLLMRIGIFIVVVIIFGIIAKIKTKKDISEATVKEYSVCGMNKENEDGKPILPMFKDMVKDTFIYYTEAAPENFSDDPNGVVTEYDGHYDCYLEPEDTDGKKHIKVYVPDSSEDSDCLDEHKIHVGWLEDDKVDEVLEMLRIYECNIQLYTAGGKVKRLNAETGKVEIDENEIDFQAIVTIAHLKNAFRG